jgi:hypothetical protein
MRLHRPVLAGLALGAVLPVTAANAAAGVTAAGSAESTATLATVSVGALLDLVEAQSVSIGSLAATAQSITSTAPAVTFVPITLNGVKTGAVTVTPSNSPQTVGAVTVGAAPLDAVSATSPGATLMASSGSTKASSLTTSLGSAKILGLPITLDGGVDVGSTTGATQSQAGKAITLSGVSLPNLADLLGALGLDLAKLPVATLNALITDLRVAIDGATQTALDNANTAVDAAQTAYDDAVADVTAAEDDLTAAAAALDSALSGADLTGTGLTGPIDHTDWDTLDPAVKTIITTANSGVATAATAYDAAKAALAAAEAAVDPLLDTLLDAIADLAGVVEGALAGVPLVEIGAADISTKALVGSSKTAAITGTISGVKVLGVDVLSEVTGDSELDVAELVGGIADDVNAALNTVSTALSNVLSGVTGATGLVVPAPEVEVMKKTTTTGTDGAYGTAMATLTALSVSLGSITVPSIYALDGAGDLPGVGAITGGFQTAPLSVNVGTVVESARFRSGTTTPTGPTHPATGGPEGLAIVAMIGTALALGVRRLRAQ